MFSVDFSHLQEEADRPGLLLLEQGETEALLLEAVQESGLCDVRFEAEVTDLAQDDEGVQLAYHKGGVEHTLEAEYAVGADGASSFVRGAIGMSFDGKTYSTRPVLADVRLADERDALPWPRLHNGADGVTFTVRLNPGHWRIVRLEPGEETKDRDVPDAEVNQRVAEVLGTGSVEIVWASRFHIHLRSSPRFRVGRVLLAGDAAHIHSPAGGMGMNAGIHDASNLAWKLAHALQGGDVERLLESYDAERRAVAAENVSRYADFITRSFLQIPIIRRMTFPLMRWLLAIPRVSRQMLRRGTMIDLRYSASPLLDDQARAAGERVPNPALHAPDGEIVRLYDLLPNAPVILDVAEQRDFSANLPVQEVIQIGKNGGYEDRTGLLRELLGSQDGWILVRPDGHIAWARTHQEGMAAAARYALGL